MYKMFIFYIIIILILLIIICRYFFPMILYVLSELQIIISPNIL